MNHLPRLHLGLLLALLLPACVRGEPAPDSPALTLQWARLYQAVEVPLVEDGAERKRRDVPVVAGKPGKLCVGVTRQAGTEGAVDLVAKVGPMGTPWRARIKLSFAGLQASRCIDVPAEAITLGAQWSVEAVHEASKLRTQLWPRTSLEVRTPGPLPISLRRLDVMLGDGTRLPSTITASQAEQIRQHAQAFLPAVLDAPLSKTATVVRVARLSGETFGQINVQLERQRDTTAEDRGRLYVGLVEVTSPATDTEYGGLASTAGRIRAATVVFANLEGGLAFTAEAVAHELMHILGRQHAPCGGTGETDARYPNPDGRLDIAAYNAFKDEFAEPEYAYDFMSYCKPSFASAYGYVRTYRSLRAFNARENGLIDDGRRPTDRLHHTYDADGYTIRGLPRAGATTLAGARVCIPGRPEVECVTTDGLRPYELSGLPAFSDIEVRIEKTGFVTIYTQRSTWVGVDAAVDEGTFDNATATSLAKKFDVRWPSKHVGVLAVATKRAGVQITVKGQPRATIYLDAEGRALDGNASAASGVALVLGLPAGRHNVTAQWKGAEACFTLYGALQTDAPHATVHAGAVTRITLECIQGWAR